MERALENDYHPDKLKSKLFYRKAMCLHALNSNDVFEFKRALNEAQKWIKDQDSIG